jgi:hypothetical protein
VLYAFVVISPARGVLLPEDDPVALYEQADLVVKGVARESLADERFQGQTEAVVRVTSRYAIKGTAGGDLAIKVKSTVGLGWNADLDPRHGDVLLFLRRNDDGTYSPVVPVRSMVRVSQKATRPPDLSRQEAAGNLAGRIRLWQEMGTAVLDRTIQSRDRVRGVQWVERLHVRPEQTRAFLRDLSGSSEDAIAAQALRQRIRGQDEGAVRQAVDRIVDGRMASRPSAQLTESLKFSTLTDAQTLAALGEALRSNDASLRESAAYALRQTDADAVVPLLVSVLNDPDPMVAYHAVMGLGRLEPGAGPPGPMLDAFDADRRKYISAWQAWWNDDGIYIYTDKPRPTESGDSADDRTPTNAEPSEPVAYQATARSPIVVEHDRVGPPNKGELDNGSTAQAHGQNAGDRTSPGPLPGTQSGIPSRSAESLDEAHPWWVTISVTAAILMVAGALVYLIYRRRPTAIGSGGPP